jgi:NADH:quinone reductase (non-electrogenic)
MDSVVTAVDSRGLEVKNHDGSVSRHQAGTVLWTAGVEAPPLAEAVATATGRSADSVR